MPAFGGRCKHDDDESLNRARRSTTATILILAATLVAGCDQSFNVIQESDRYFSIYGMLDGAMDTQWIRIAPVRDSAFTAPGPIDAVVTLAKVGGDKVVVLEDLPTRYTSHDSIVVSDHFAHNFWTVERIEYGAKYRLTATRSDGASSYAVVSIPRRIESVTVGIVQPPYTQFDYVHIDHPEHVAIVQVVHHGGVLPLKHYEYQGTGSLNPSDGSWDFRNISRLLDKEHPTNRCFEGYRCEILMVTSADRWLYDPSRTRGAVNDINATSNITNGVGFLGGIATKLVPYEECRAKVVSTIRR
jgi:hypothetical protein